MSERRTAFRTCPLCEATCGLELAVEDDRIVRVRGDKDHVLSHGFLCPKGAAYGHLVHDPDRLRRPLVKGADGEHHEVSWDEAFAAVDAGLRGVIDRHGPSSLAAYAGNPSVHNISGSLYLRHLLRALPTTNRFSASTVDQMPKHVSCGLVFGHPLSIPVPDIDRTDFMIVLGANPWESNGSLWTVPDAPGRFKAMQARGGRFVVVDPRRTKTAEEADEHIAIRPGADGFLLLGMVHTLFDEGLVSLGRLEEHVVGVDEVHALAKGFPPEEVAAACGIDAERIRGLARELAAAERAIVYGRIGTCTVPFGTLNSWLVDVLNALTANLDEPGGAMFPLAAHQQRPTKAGGKGYITGRFSSRVRGLPEVNGELPVACLAEEIDTPGDGQIRALVTVAGNPARSAPNSDRLERALASLEFMVSVDPYLNETTRHADVILPPTDGARVGHYDLSFSLLGVRNVAVYSPPVLPPAEGELPESDIIARLTLIAEGAAPDTDPDVLHERLLTDLLGRVASALGDRTVEDLRADVTGDGPAERLLDVMLRAGAYGDLFGLNPDGLSMAALRDNPHGIDLGPLEPMLPEYLKTPSGKVELAPPALVADVARLRAALDAWPVDGDAPLVLVGRRHLRSNNSWMHNVKVLVKGKERCTLQVNPSDAGRLGLADGATARVASRVGAVDALVEVTDIVMPGVVSLPHGWGHGAPGTRMEVAAAHAGVNSNALTDELELDPLSGNAVLNGIPVEVTAV